MKKKRTKRLADNVCLLKMIRIMRFTIFIVFLSLSQVFAVNSYSQQTKLSLDMKNVRVEEVIDQIEKDTEFFFMYNKDIIDVDRKINIRVEEKDVNEVLDQIFENTGVSYSIKGRQILLAISNVSVLGEGENLQQRKNLSGSVTDTSGQPLPGVSVVVKGTTTGTITDFDGKYRLSVPGGSTLVFSFVGMKTQEIIVSGKDQINVVMVEESIGLEEVVAIGYGSMRKSDLTGSVASVSSDEMTAFPAVNAVQALQGRTAGLQIQSTNGEPGAAYTVRIRGASSINAASDPIYVVDGFVGASLPPAEDIESVEILKDASATAIYGSRGANGVIIVSTKRGKSGETRIDLNASYSVQKEIKRLELLDREGYIDYITEYAPGAVFGDADTDWQDVVLKQGKIQNYQLSVSGGSEKVKYYLSGVYYDQDGVIVTSEYNRMSLQSNIDVHPADRIRFGANIFMFRDSRTGVRTQENSGAANAGVISLAYNYDPTTPVFNVDGTYARSSPNSDNPYAVAMERTDERISDKMQANLYAELELLEGLTFRSTLGANASNSRRGEYVPTTLTAGANVNGDASMSTSKSTMLLNEDYLTYAKELSDGHRLTILGGYSYQKGHDELLGASGQAFISDALSYWNLSSATVRGESSSGIIETKLVSWYGRLNYSLKDKYLFTFTSRYDGSSSFSKNHKWAFFPSGAFAWNVKNEPFLQNTASLSQLKLRASYGETGNQAIAAYQTLARMSFSPAVIGGTAQNGVRPTTVANNELTWETTNQTDVGLDAGLFDNRINVTADYYYKKTKDLLFNVPLPQYSGYGEQLKNIGAVENKGFEFSLTTRNLVHGFKWNTNFNISFNRNEILSLPDGQDILYESFPTHIIGVGSTQVLRVGQAVGAFYGFVYDGVYQEGDTFIPGSGFEQVAGGEKFKDVNGRDAEGNLTGEPDGQLNNDDRTIIGNPHPDFFWGLTNTFTWKGFDLNIFIQGIRGNDIYSYTLMELGNGKGHNGLSSRLSNRWKPTHTDTDVAKVSSQRVSRSSSQWIFDGSYVRLKNISLGYTLPKSLLGGTGISSLRLYVSAQNFLTITNYPGVDPEVAYRSGGAESRNTNVGLDYGSYPNARSVTFGLNIAF
ncbi:MAG: TonB-dependent receptor [Prolixibacteraceae bacterium]|jgi:TonB-linked SusC/RagA family outer membrane protein|nr:TonB-dependent receptor [Prolixibacteraceae bacterium]